MWFVKNPGVRFKPEALKRIILENLFGISGETIAKMYSDTRKNTFFCYCK